MAWPVRSGTLPFPGDGVTERPETGPRGWDALWAGVTVILGPPEPGRPGGPDSPDSPASLGSPGSPGSPGSAGGQGGPAGPGGTGKTGLAAAFAAQLWAAGQLDLLAWIDAGSRDSIVSGYARVLADIRVAAAPGQPEAAAARLLSWLAATGRPWLIVLDGLADAADADGLWPHGPAGQVLATTGLAGVRPPPAVSAAPATAGRGTPPARELVAVGLPAFSQREALSYLAARLDDDPYQVAGSLDLAIGLGCLPAGLHLAVTYLLDSGQNCRQYRLASERYRPDPGQLARDPLAPAWMLAVGRAVQLSPAELAWPALRLAAVLGPAGIPGAILTSPAACGYITGQPGGTSDDQARVRLAFGNLQRLGLVAVAPDDDVRTVRVAAALQASVRRAMGPSDLGRAVRAAADAICACWPAGATTAPGLEQALRDCATSVQRCGGPALWDGGPHPLLARAGRSLDDAPMPLAAASYWRQLAARCGEYLGAQSAAALQFRGRQASAAVAAGRADEALALYKELAADIDAAAGPDGPEAIAVQASLAAAYRAAGRLESAISLAERVAADCQRVLGPAQPQTTQSLRALGGAYADAGRDPEAISALRRCLGTRERSIGLMHPETIAVRHELADIYRRSGRPEEAIGIYQEALAQVEKVTGAAYPGAVAAREHVAIAYYRAGRTDDAAATLRQAIAEWERLPGAGPAYTIAARASLAAIYCLSGRLREAFPLYESELADLERIRGPGHPDTLRARWNLAAACHKARRLPEAISLGEAALADCEQFLGPGHRETLSARANLAHACHAAGMLKRASAHFDRALRDCEQSLGPDDSLTEAVRVLRKRYLAGRQGAAPIITGPAA
ncbi:MAG TPA: tetratricopeptide repeat protein [Streptosporangiaceae bacterium]